MKRLSGSAARRVGSGKRLPIARRAAEPKEVPTPRPPLVIVAWSSADGRRGAIALVHFLRKVLPYATVWHSPEGYPQPGDSGWERWEDEVVERAVRALSGGGSVTLSSVPPSWSGDFHEKVLGAQAMVTVTNPFFLSEAARAEIEVAATFRPHIPRFIIVLGAEADTKYTRDFGGGVKVVPGNDHGVRCVVSAFHRAFAPGNDSSDQRDARFAAAWSDLERVLEGGAQTAGR